ncbi:phosphoadenosine phosphosulfate reductase family protein [Polaromonas sp.]|uniref:phosphoadenosine phosphosulfate reductase domain-containing protein n=1 Tax=Polaromonas sp. TaxID=1869339 RepID=UPI00352BC647
MKTKEQPVNFLRKLVPQLGLPVSTAPEIEAALASNAVCAVSISGGKDSVAAAIATWKHLDLIGHTGPRVLIHADLGVVEWKDSLPCCERLAAYLGAELIVVRRKAGDMMDRWEGRWTNNVIRYNDLSCVKLILPWSTPSMRFCTSELKSVVLSSALKKRFPGQDIVSVSGVRRQESSSRAKMSTWSVDQRLTRKNLLGLTWNAIIDWDIEQVFQTIADAGLALHEAYTTYGASRVSCAFCIMSAARDLIAAASCADNQMVYRRMVDLEITSTFAFQGGKWLGDTAPHLLTTEAIEGLARAKQSAIKRESVEAELPKHLLFTKGWPTGMPTTGEAELIASVRTRVSTLVGLDSRILTGDEVLARYDQLLQAKALKAPELDPA